MAIAIQSFPVHTHTLIVYFILMLNSVSYLELCCAPFYWSLFKLQQITKGCLPSRPWHIQTLPTHWRITPSHRSCYAPIQDNDCSKTGLNPLYDNLSLEVCGTFFSLFLYEAPRFINPQIHFTPYLRWYSFPPVNGRELWGREIERGGGRIHRTLQAWRGERDKNIKREKELCLLLQTNKMPEDGNEKETLNFSLEEFMWQTSEGRVCFRVYLCIRAWIVARWQKTVTEVWSSVLWNVNYAAYSGEISLWINVKMRDTFLCMHIIFASSKNYTTRINFKISNGSSSQKCC